MIKVFKICLAVVFSLFFAPLGVFEGARYWDIFAEYSKNTPNDVLVNITVANRGPQKARVRLLPTLWFRNTWSWGCDHEACTCGSEPEGCRKRPKLIQTAPGVVECHHDTLGKYIFTVGSDQEGQTPEMIFTENETNYKVSITFGKVTFTELWLRTIRAQFYINNEIENNLKF